MRIFFETILFGLPILLVTTAFAQSTDFIRKGAEAFREGDFALASEAFEEAQRKTPDDSRIAFNRGASLAADGQFDAAITVLQQTAVAADKTIAAKSLDLLSRIAVARIKERLPDPPETATPEQRREILDYLQAAERYSMEAAELQPIDETTRRNLEELRSWRGRIEALWDTADREKNRQGDVADRLGRLENLQGNLAASIKRTAEETNSPKKYQKFYETAKEQQRLIQELAVVENDFRHTVAGAMPSDSQTDDSEQSEADWVFREFEQIHRNAQNVRESLERFQGGPAVEAAEQTIDRIDRLRMGLSPFEAVAREAEKKQSVLCDANPAGKGTIEGDPLPSDDSAFDPGARSSTSDPLRDDSEKQVREQHRVEGWMPLMVFRARQEIEHLEAMRPHSEKQTENNAPLDGDAEVADARKQSMELAVKHGPEVQTLAGDAARLLQENDPGSALPKQQRALELLREILKPLQQQNQDQQNQDQQNQDQQNQDQQNQDQQNQDQKNSDSQEQQQQDKERQDHNSQKQNVADSKPPERELTSQEKKEELEKTQRMLRQVKRRQQDAREKRERIRALIQQFEPVDKDW